jgi:hypothetical protein
VLIAVGVAALAVASLLLLRADLGSRPSGLDVVLLGVALALVAAGLVCVVWGSRRRER